MRASGVTTPAFAAALGMLLAGCETTEIATGPCDARCTAPRRAILQWTMLLWAGLSWATLPAVADTLPPVAAPQAASEASAAAPPPASSQEDPDAPDLHPRANSGCTPDSSHGRQPSFSYDYTGGMVWEDQVQPGYPRNGREIDHRLHVGCLVGVQYEHLYSSLPDPAGSATMDTLALVASVDVDDPEFLLTFGLGATRYRAMQQTYTMATIPLAIRREILSGYSVEGMATVPLRVLYVSGFTQGHPDDRGRNTVWELVLRYDWENVALRVGKRSYQISYGVPGTTQENAVRRSGEFLGISFMY